MKKNLLLACGLTIALFATAQKAMSFAVEFSSGTATYSIPENDWTAAAFSPDEIVNGRYYRYVHFNSLPGFQERTALEKSGVRILNFIGRKTYSASIATGVQFPLDPLLNLRSASTMSAESKMHFELKAAIETNGFPFFAIDKDNNIGITFTAFADIPHSIVLDQLYAKNEIVTYHNANSHRFTVWMQRENIESFLLLPFVQAAELKDDVARAENNEGRTDHRDNWLAQDFAGGRMYNGAGVNVMLQDDGIIGPHIDYTGRVIQQYVQVNIGDHGDHCAGIIMGGGNKDPLTRGMGWGANLYVYQAIPYTGYDSIYDHYITNNIVITSTSYSDGCNAGYTTLAQTLDQQIWDMPNLIHVFSAGNNGTSDCNYGAGANWGNITGGHKTSKNSIAVGNLNYIDALESSSSRGPVEDGRMKPEVCAVGTNVYSTIDANNYGYKTGTSMSCPAVSGTFSELYQAYREINGVLPQSGLMKAILMNTCDDLGNAGPDYKHGYGRINGRKAIIPIEQNMYYVDSITNGGNNTHTISVPAGTGQLKVMIYWHDFPGAVNAAVALVNNLDMQVVAPSSSVFNPWVLDYTPNVNNLNALAVRGNDVRNNHEQVTIDNPAAGTYTVNVSGTTVPMGPQTYFLVWYFEPLDELVLTYPNGGEGLSPGETQTIRWDAWENTGTFDLEYTTDDTAWTSITTGVSASQRYYNWAVPAALSGQCRVRITRGSTVDSSDARFTIAAIPSGLHVAWSCADSLCLKWTTVQGATSYDVFTLGNMYMDSIGNTALDSFVVTGLSNFTNTYWYSVRTKAPRETVGRRAIAIEKTPGVFCPGTYDASVTAVTSPAPYYFGCMPLTNIPVVISIYNPALTTLTSVPVSYSYDGGTPVNETYTGTIPSFTTVTYTFTTTMNVGAPGAHTLETWSVLPNDISSANDTMLRNLNVYTSTTVTPAYSENFETFPLCSSIANCGATNCALINGWTNIPNGTGDDIDWRTNQGNTPTSGTGPSTDYIPGTAQGNYLFLQANTCFNKTAEVISPCIDLTTFQSPTLLLGYHMYGANMGSLHLDVFANGVWVNDVWVRTGSQNTNWLQASIPLSTYVGQVIILRFRGITGGGNLSDIAIDGIRVEDVTGIDENSAASMVSVYPNPGDGMFNLAVTNLRGDESLLVNVYDVAGRLVSSEDFGRPVGTLQSTIDLSGKENGVYFIEVVTGDQKETLRATKTE